MTFDPTVVNFGSLSTIQMMLYPCLVLIFLGSSWGSWQNPQPYEVDVARACGKGQCEISKIRFASPTDKRLLLCSTDYNKLATNVQNR